MGISRAALFTGLAGAGTELAIHGLTPRGLIGATIASMIGTGSAKAAEDSGEIRLDGKSLQSKTKEAGKLIVTALVVNLFANALISLFAATATLPGAIALAGLGVASYYLQSDDEDQPFFIKAAHSAIPLISAVAGAELTAMTAHGVLKTAAFVAPLGVGFAGTGVSLILGLAFGYFHQRSDAISASDSE